MGQQRARARQPIRAESQRQAPSRGHRGRQARHLRAARLVTKDEIIAFGRAFDPQPMHTDEEAAKATPVGGLCASGWHTCAMMMRMICDGLLHRMASLGSPGVDEVRWTKPVRPGDVLSLRYTAQEKRVLASRPDVGIVQGAGRARRRQGRGAWHLAHQPAHARAQSRRRRRAAAGAQARRSRRSPACGTRPAADRPARRTPSSRIAQHRRDHRLRPPHLRRATRSSPSRASSIRSPSTSTRRPPRPRCSAALCASGWHTAAIFIRGVVTHAAAGQCRGAAPGASGCRSTVRRRASATCAGRSRLRRRHHRVPRAADREDRPQVAPRPRPAGQRGAGPQPERRDRVRPHLADPGRAARATGVGGSSPMSARAVVLPRR